MCLDIITKKYDPPDPTERIGWKVFAANQLNGTLQSVFFNTTTALPVNTWLTAMTPSVFTGESLNHRCKDNSFSHYEAGWHVFPALKDAWDYADGRFEHVHQAKFKYVRKVKYRNTIAEGREAHGESHVAQDMLIIDVEETKYNPTVAQILQAINGIDRKDYPKLVEAVRLAWDDPDRDSVECLRDAIAADDAEWRKS